MGNNSCCDSSSAQRHRETNPQPNYTSSYQKTQPNKSQKQISTGNPPPAVTPEPEGQLIEEPITPQNNRRASLGSSVKMSSNSGGKISQISSVKNKNDNLPQSKINQFNLVKSIQAHDKIIVCMIELQNFFPFVFTDDF